MKVSKTINLNEYQTMFDDMVIDKTKVSQILSAVNTIKSSETRYTNLANSVNPKMPWYAIALAHYMECNCNFNKHIHTGDPLTTKTVNVPKDRPVNPPANGKKYTWEESATDWLKLKKWDKWQNWGVRDILYRLELNNGMGYRKIFEMATPYLWSFSQFYTEGKYTSDGQYDPNAISKQAGAAIILKYLIQ